MPSYVKRYGVVWWTYASVSEEITTLSAGYSVAKWPLDYTA